MDKASSEYWQATNTSLGAFQWGNIGADDLAALVAQSVPVRGRVLVAGAGTSHDARALQAALPGAAVLAPDFTAEAVRFQRELGVPSEQQDLLQPRADWAGAFDVVVDAAFTDVFMSNWGAGDRDAAVRARYSASARAALANLLSYVKPGGALVVKSMVQNEDEYAAYVRAAARLDYAPGVVLGSSELRARNPPRAGGARSRSGRPIAGGGLGVDGHVSVWTVPPR